jgi:hypothetical protein
MGNALYRLQKNMSSEHSGARYAVNVRPVSDCKGGAAAQAVGNALSLQGHQGMSSGHSEVRDMLSAL